jgi:hypothetical protein
MVDEYLSLKKLSQQHKDKALGRSGELRNILPIIKLKDRPYNQIKSAKDYTFTSKISNGVQSFSRNSWLGLFLSLVILSSPVLVYKLQSGSGNNPMDTYHSGKFSGYKGLRPRWGIVGLGRVANDFCEILTMMGANITAVAAGSLPNSKARAEEFANKFNIPTFFENYEDIALFPNVDIIYIATTNQLHFNLSMLMLNNNKHVLVEKPAALHSREVLEMFDLAKSKGLLLITNYWTRFFPGIK